jgi:hypothetical protein
VRGFRAGSLAPVFFRHSGSKGFFSLPRTFLSSDTETGGVEKWHWPQGCIRLNVRSTVSQAFRERS